MTGGRKCNHRQKKVGTETAMSERIRYKVPVEDRFHLIPLLFILKDLIFKYGVFYEYPLLLAAEGWAMIKKNQLSRAATKIRAIPFNLGTNIKI